MSLTLLTTTGCRQEAFDLSQKMAMAQDYEGSVRWLIIDDGEEPTKITFERPNWKVEVIRRKPYWKPGQNTQRENLQLGLCNVMAHEKLVIWEDDDLYLPGYLTFIAGWLHNYLLVGERDALYYHVANRTYKFCGNQTHASLCNTGLTGKAIDALRVIVKANQKFIDILFWRSFRQGGRVLRPTRNIIGIKGLPGRDGIGGGHRMTGTSDLDLSILTKHAGAEAAGWYTRYYPGDTLR